LRSYLYPLIKQLYYEWQIAQWKYSRKYPPLPNLEPIYCIGDSHVSLFTGTDTMPPVWPRKSKDCLPFFRTFRLGPVLAYNLVQTGTTTRGREKLFDVLDSVVPKGSRVMLVFGEIDCRVQFIRQSRKQNQPIDVIVAGCVERYFSVVLEIRDRGYQPLIWNVIATANHMPDGDFPTVGTPQERNHAAKLFNQKLEDCCDVNGIPFISIFDSIVDENNHTNMGYFWDCVHLSQRAMPLAITAIQRYGIGINITE
jgi:hypothetical protein